jgi:hypothetical protein
MVLLLPRLPSIAADRMLNDRIESIVSGAFTFDPHELPPAVRFAPTGGTRITPAQLGELRSGIMANATACGFGQGVGARHLAEFDSRMAARLADDRTFASGEALRDDVWTFVSVVIAPDVVHWRFGTARDRYLGGVRNTFQRLWLRGRVLDRGQDASDRWGLLRALSEDALVQIIERPSLGADAILACAIAEAWVRAAARFGKGRMEPIMRRASLRIRVQNEIQSLACLDREKLARLLDTFFDTAARSLDIRATRTADNVEAAGI